MSKIKVTFDGDEAKLFRKFQRLQDAQDKLIAKSRESGNVSKKATDKAAAGMDKSAGRTSNAIDKLAGYAAGFMGVQKAIKFVTDALAELERRRAGAAQVIIETEMSAAKLAQLASTHAEYREIIKTGKEIYRGGGALSLEEGYATAFQLKSAGALQEADFFTRLKGVVPEIPEVAGATAKIQAAMGKGETGSLEALVGKGIAAAAPVTDVGVREMLLAATKPAKLAKQMGLSDEELLAAVSIAAKGAEGPEVAGTQVKQMLATLMTKPGFKGLSLQEMVEKVKPDIKAARKRTRFEDIDFARWEGAEEVDLLRQKPGVTEKEAKKWFGRIQGYQAFLALEDADIEGRVGEISAGAGEAQKRIDIAMGLGSVREARDWRKKQAAMKLDAEMEGRQRIRGDIVLEELYEKEGGGFRAAVHYGVRKSVQTMFGDAVMGAMFEAGGLSEEGRRVVAGEGVQGLPGVRLSEETMARAAAKLDSAADKMSGGAAMGYPNEDK